MVVEELSRQSHAKSWVERERDALEKIIPNSIKNQLNKKKPFELFASSVVLLKQTNVN